MKKITILLIVVLGMGIGIAFNRNSPIQILPMQDNDSENDSGCCMDPPCKECFEELGYCDCEEIEENGGEACEECEREDPVCGENNDSGICELDAIKNVTDKI